MMSTNLKDQTNTNNMHIVGKQRSFTGRVTKFFDDFGFVDDDVFFQLSVVKGGNIHVNDQVYVECQYSEDLPFKWNATKVEIIPQQAPTTVASTYLQHRVMLQQQRDQQPQAQSYYTHDTQLMQQQQQMKLPQSQTQTYQQQEAIQQAYATEYKQQHHPQHQTQSYDDYSTSKQQLLYYSRQQASQTSQQEYSTSSPSPFQQITYTSTPGSAFVSTQILPYAAQQVAAAAAAAVAQIPPTTQQRSVNRSNSSRWDESRNRDESRSRSNREDRKFDDREREREKTRERRVNRERDDHERVDRREKERSDREKDYQRARRSTESPLSIASTSDVSHPGKPLRRRYDPVNIPKFAILKYGAIHIPSDFREVRVNDAFTLDIASIPKPIVYRIVSPKTEKRNENNSSQDTINNSVEEPDKSSTETNKVTISKEPKTVQTNKYAVKVLFVSLPSMNDIYDRVFGSDRDNFTSRNNGEEPNLIATAVRCVKQQTGIDLSTCRRWKRIATFVYDRDDSLRVDVPLEYSYIFMPDVWSLLDTSLKNEVVKNDEIGDENRMVIDESVSLLSTNKTLTTEKVDDCVKNENTGLLASTEGANKCETFDVKNSVSDNVGNSLEVDLTVDYSSFSQPKEVLVDGNEPSPSDNEKDAAVTSSDRTVISQLPESKPSSHSEEADSAFNSSLNVNTACKTSNSEAAPSPSDKHQLLVRLNDLKVAELKTELEKRGIKIKSNIKKSDLIAKLREILLQSIDNDEDENVVLDSVKGNWWAKRIKEESDKKDDQFDSVFADANDLSANASDSHEIDAIGQTKDANEKHEDEDTVEDILRLFHNCNFPLSKKVWNALFGTEEKQYYRSLKEPPHVIDYFKIYAENSSYSAPAANKEVGPIFTKDGNIYDVLQLISQSENDEKIKSDLRDKLTLGEEKIEQQKTQISELESRQKKMNAAIEKQNDEICALKREKEALKSKYDQMRKLFDSTVQNFNDLLKEMKEEN
ncbi:hypothetical protein B4U79_16125 [Dinothrombium tinctorium]|uniref:DBC1/CARP1 catalytically inactive NUDIX hydrolase domain-containing protein n=1 Tax=Dinothrombium tinctorium TaxID=1965070 RepID=A0A3S4QTG1_9ACAR|nr:hypothetical protein B4U79_16126 [Dinothrombium tinctorium]RWS07602.1 hypothetical protein B4U79_16125 [Dinothrombium tinctorium]